jgi:hypothetical protein
MNYYFVNVSKESVYGSVMKQNPLLIIAPLTALTQFQGDQEIVNYMVKIM